MRGRSVRRYRRVVFALAMLAGACAKPSDAPTSERHASQNASHSNAASAAKPATSALGPPGAYWVPGKLCGDDDCDNIPGRWRATAPADLYADADGAVKIVAHVAAQEWVNLPA